MAELMVREDAVGQGPLVEQVEVELEAQCIFIVKQKGSSGWYAVLPRAGGLALRRCGPPPLNG